VEFICCKFHFCDKKRLDYGLAELKDILQLQAMCLVIMIYGNVRMCWMAVEGIKLL
jgi:hypothetical protein